MKTFTIYDIRSWNSSCSYTKYLPQGWSGTALNILEDYPEIPIQDRFWVVLREEVLSPKLLRLFAVWCARQVQHLMKDDRSVAALDVAERYANGLATRAELRGVWLEAHVAIWSTGPSIESAESITFASALGVALGVAELEPNVSAWSSSYLSARATAFSNDSKSGQEAWSEQLNQLVQMIKSETIDY